MLNTAQITLTAVKSSCDERVNDIQRLVRSHITCRQAEDIRIKETAGVLSHTRFPTDSGSYMRVRVSGHRHTVSGVAEADTQVTFAFLYSRSHRMGKIREVTILHGVTAEIDYLGTFTLQVQLNHGFESKTCVVTCHRNGQFFDWFHTIILFKNMLAIMPKGLFFKIGHKVTTKNWNIQGFDY